MAECIEREKVFAKMSRLLVSKSIRTNYEDGWDIAMCKAMSIVEKAPAADVRPERHGEWVHLGGDEWGCSYCGFVISTESSREHPISETQCNDYCRKCGTKMNGKDGENNG